MASSMYENLMTLPLFKGVSYNRVSEIVGKTRLGFLKYLPLLTPVKKKFSI